MLPRKGEAEAVHATSAAVDEETHSLAITRGLRGALARPLCRRATTFPTRCFRRVPGHAILAFTFGHAKKRILFDRSQRADLAARGSICGCSLKNEIQQRAVNFNSAIIINEAEPSKFIHKEAYTRARGADHRRKRLLADIRD